MLLHPEGLLEDFLRNLKSRHGFEIESSDLTHELCKAPIDQKKLRLLPAKGAVYVFSLSGCSKAPAGPNRVLKVGKVGSKSLSRFKYQHYNPGSANSTLAGSIKLSGILWEYIGFNSDTHETADFGKWLMGNADRDHFFVKDLPVEMGDKKIYPLELLEIYLKGVLGPVFEG
ncbi:MAG: hypothetical protein JRI71_16050 [Deltaproteobacteria bacterium]|nr:hypothetical protein [Deltaproteobacteria bacterium]